MTAILALMSALAFVVSFQIARKISINGQKLGLIQVPNHRSSHYKPTVSGGGLGIAVAGTLLVLPSLAGAHAMMTWAILVSAVGGLVGFLDDRLDLPARYRIVLHVLLVGMLIYVTLGLSAPGFTIDGIVALLTWGTVLFLGVWWINLFNFMDGIDGIAASEAIFILGAAASFVVLGDFGDASWTVVLPLCVVAAACMGFLLLNWPPARVFMGDAGSNYLAFFTLSMALISFANGYISGAIWVILPAAFVSDATVTLFRRILAGERWFAAHREHTYQRLSRRWNGHLKVTLLYAAINMLWLFPLAFLARNQSSMDWLIALVAYCPLVVLCIAAQAGLSDRPATNGRKRT
ncbi:glycosyltransferase family 4 protein [Devosia sp.]|uniref:MraY family glycosyltransferase n=1 Tax=Devosia sp. TaxID=1871048 RepID=UPI002734A21A|nr:glycosyltransferase family 4 protein [Devosia sp.]MDP2782165.1 glycosyltransferase family 4 protein [Devosia sp.]